MADVTSTARLIVTVEGEDKIKALADKLKSLGKGGKDGDKEGGGTKDIVGKLKDEANKVVAAVRPALEASKSVARTIAPIAQQQQSLAKTVAANAAATSALGRARDARGRFVKGAADDQAAVPGTAAAATVAKAAANKVSTAEMAAAMTAAKAAEARLKARPKAPVLTDAEVKANADKMKDELAAKYAPSAKQLAARQAAGVGTPAKAAGLAEGEAAAAGGGVTAARIALGGLGIALGVVAGGAIAAGAAIWTLSKNVGDAFKEADRRATEVTRDAGARKRSGETADQLSERKYVGEGIYGEGYESLEKRLPRLISSRNKQMKGALETLGAGPKDVKKIEQKQGRRFDATNLGELYRSKREELEAQIANAKGEKDRAKAKEKLRTLDDAATRVMGKENADRAARGKAEDIAKDREFKKKSDEQFGTKVPQDQREAEAARHEREQRQAKENAQNMREKSADQLMPSVNNVQQTWRTMFQETLGSQLTDLQTNINRITLEGINTGLTTLGTTVVPVAVAALQSLNSALGDVKFDDLTKKISDWFGKTKAFVDKLVGQDDKDKRKDIPPAVTPADTVEDEKAKEQIRMDNYRRQQRRRHGLPDLDEGYKKPPEPPTPKPAAEDLPKPKIEFEADGFQSQVKDAGTQGGQAFGEAVTTGVKSAGQSGGDAFSSAARTGITDAGTAGGNAFKGAIDPAAIGSAIGQAAAAQISAAKVNVNVSGATNGRTAPGSKGTDSPTAGTE